jgi:hypothetical protein
MGVLHEVFRKLLVELSFDELGAWICINAVYERYQAGPFARVRIISSPELGPAGYFAVKYVRAAASRTAGCWLCQAMSYKPPLSLTKRTLDHGYRF